MRSRAVVVASRAWLAGAVVFGASACRTVGEVAETFARGEERQLRARPTGDPPRRRGGHPILIVALDGVNAATLYDALEEGHLPGLATLLGGESLEHAHLHPNVAASLPTITIGGWTTTFTGAAPAHHGVPGNEFFVRSKAQFVAPVPVSYSDTAQMLSTLNDNVLGEWIAVPTVYQQLRSREPNIEIWVANHPITSGADKLISAEPSAVVEALASIVSHKASSDEKDARTVPAELDEETFESVIECIHDERAPDVLTVYLAGPDHYAHKSALPPERAIRQYLIEELDARFLKLHATLDAEGAMQDRYVIVTADHGHTDVMRDEAHALGRKRGGVVQDVLAAAGFRPRPPERKVRDPFSAVVAYAGGMAFVYVADRSRCNDERCDWASPPRRRDDLIPAADALFQASKDRRAPLGGKLDMILVRSVRPNPPFEVYVGDGRTMSVRKWLEDNPRPTYVRLAERLADLGHGPQGDRAGDIVLIANSGNRDDPADRFYFDQPYESWHGSPSTSDSIIPVIIANANESSAELAKSADRVFGRTASQQDIAALVLYLREHE